MPSTFWDKIGTGCGPNYVSALLLTVVNLINYMDRHSLSPILDDLKKEFGFDDEWKIRVLRSVQYFALAIIPPVYGILADRISRKLMMILSLSLSSTFVIICSFANSYWTFAVLQFIVGSGQAGFITIAPTVIADLFAASISKNTSTLSIWLLIFYIQIPVGMGLGFLIGGFITERYGWRWAIRGTVFLSWPLICILLFVLKDPTRGGSELSIERSRTYKEMSFRTVISDIKNIFSVPSFWLSCIGTTFMFFSTIGAAQYLFVLPKYASRYQEIELGIDVTREPQEPFEVIVGALIIGGGFIGTITGTFLSVMIRPRYPWIDPIIVGAGVLISAIILIPTALVAEFSIYAYLSLLFFCIAFSSTNWAVLTDMMLYIIPPSLRSTSLGLYMMIIHGFGDSVSSFVVALIVHLTHTDNKDSSKYHSLQNGMWLTVVSYFLSGLVFLYISKFVVSYVCE